MRGFRYFTIAFFLALSIAASANFARAQQQVTLGQSIVALNGPWKFHTGDNPAWADPNFDDSSWETVDLTPNAGVVDPVQGFSGYVPGWTARGHRGYWGYAWYRIRVRIAARPGEKLALVGPASMDDGYQVFADGTLLGSFGKFPGHGRSPVIYHTQPEVFWLPQPQAGGDSNFSPGTSQRTYVLAFRCWMEPVTMTFEPEAGGFRTAPWMGVASAVEAQYQLERLEQIRGLAFAPIEAALFLVLAIVACSLIVLDRSDPVYLWLAAAFLLMAIYISNLALGVWTMVESGMVFMMTRDVILLPLILGGWVMVWWVWFRLRQPSWMPKAVAVLTVLYALSNALGDDFFFTVVSQPVSAVFHVASLVARLLFLLLLVLIVVWGIREQGREAWLALPAVVLVGIAQFEDEFSVLHVRVAWFPFGMRAGFSDIAYLALAAAIFVLLVRRLQRSIRRQRETALEIEQAREVQQMLIPVTPPDTPGFAVESVYLPAQKVGGDFFQILPGDDGSLLIVVGDVSGKGLKAAMTVSTIIGALRDYPAREPAEILAHLNRALHGQISGFVTCCAVFIAADCTMTIANAGHLSPYRNGAELTVEGGLPLGIVVDGDYAETRYQLAPGDRLTFVSDGVVEATNEKKELFGFERTQAISTQPAHAIAETAKQFGQEDDISVLSVTRNANMKAALA